MNPRLTLLMMTTSSAATAVKPEHAGRENHLRQGCPGELLGSHSLNLISSVSQTQDPECRHFALRAGTPADVTRMPIGTCQHCWHLPEWHYLLP
jgi:hypothetical protein